MKLITEAEGTYIVSSSCQYKLWGNSYTGMQRGFYGGSGIVQIF